MVVARSNCSRTEVDSYSCNHDFSSVYDRHHHVGAAAAAGNNVNDDGGNDDDEWVFVTETGRSRRDVVRKLQHFSTASG